MLELFMPTRKVFKGKVSDELRMETKRISKERAELQERMEARARELQKQLDEERYLCDPESKQLVDVMISMIHKAQFTPTELREAAILAATKYEMMRGGK